MKNILLLLLIPLMLSCSPAYSWGDREQGILTGISGLLLLDHMSKRSDYTHRHKHSNDRRAFERQHYDRHYYFKCVLIPIYNNRDDLIGYKEKCTPRI